MILKVVREKETKYYVPTQIQAMTVSAVYNSDDMYDVTFSTFRYIVLFT